MNKKDSEKSENIKNTIEITIPFNSLVSSAYGGSENDVTKKEQKNNQSDENDSDDENTSKKGQMSSQVDKGKSSNDATSKKRQVIINISEK